MSKIKITFVFIILGLGQFLAVFISSWGTFPVSDFAIGIIVYLFFMMMQVLLVINLFKTLSSIRFLYVIFSILNAFYFTFILTDWSKWEFIFYCFLTIFFLYISSIRDSLRESVLIFLLLIATPIVQNLLINKNIAPEDNQYKEIDTSLYKRNIYIIGIDGMVSQMALEKIFGANSSVAYDWIRNNEFALYDIISPGDATLTTYGTLITGNKDLHPRTVRPYINGSRNSAFYSAVKNAGYKIQFFNDNDYLGTDSGFLDNFLPKSNTLSICGFIDKRWAFYFCNWINYFGIPINGNTSLSEKINFYKNNAIIKSDDKWFSINHIWFPGHTFGTYDGSNKKDFDEFKNYYLDSQYPLRNALADLTSFIKKNDPDPVIVFMGDHGSFALRSKNKFTFNNYSIEEMNDLIYLDARSSLLAVFPKDFCSDKIDVLDTSKLFINFLECLEGY